MKNVSIQLKLFGLVGVFAAGFAIYMAVVHHTTKESLQESDYTGVIAMKDVIADVLPPPLYVIETYLVGVELAREHDALRTQGLRDRYKVLRSEMVARERYWTEQLERTAVREALLGDAMSTGKAVFAVVDERLLPALDASDASKVEASLAALQAAYATHRTAIDKVVGLATSRAQEHEALAADTIRTRKLKLLGLGIALVLLGVLFAASLARDIARRAQSTATILSHVADGDLSQRLDVDSRDELGQVALKLNEALDSIDNVFVEVHRVSSEVAAAANHLAHSSEQISAGAQQQAASLEETAASLEEITATVKQSAGNAQQASQLAVGSRDVAERGGSVVGDAVRAMNDITQASRRIGDIITTIDEIALQTNLLALNAAVEAARAGEQGRGFAVVAAEVGNLAQRSAAAAKEVKALIQDSLQRVESGHQLVGESGRVLNDIIHSVKKVTDIVGEIAAASREQSAGVDQVNQAVGQMDQVTQTNAAQTEDLSRTSDGLAENAEHLSALLGRFKLKGTRASVATERSGNGSGRRHKSERRGRVMGDRESRAIASAPANANSERDAEFEVV